MWAYIARRLLLMVPMLFVISLINFLLINWAPAPRSSNVQASGEFDASKSMEANEGEHIFRSTFFLDRPILFNTRFLLEDEEILWLLTTPLREWELPADRRQATHDLDDYGRTIVPHLMRLAQGAQLNRTSFGTGGVRRAYEQRWRDQRPLWVEEGRPPGASVWPPPGEAPPFDGAACARIVSLCLSRLANNAPRRPVVVYGEDATDEILRRNKEVRKEQAQLRRIFRTATTTDAEKLEQWIAWYEPQREEWEYSLADKARMLFLETRFAKYWRNLLSLDLGTSFTHRQKVWKLITERMHVSLSLSLGSLLIAYLLSVPLGILSAVKHRSVGDAITSVALFALYSLPPMFLGVLLVQYFAIDWRLFPVSGFNGPNYGGLTVFGKLGDTLHHILLPLLTMTVGYLAIYSRYMKAGLIEIIRADYIRTARAKGLSEFIVIMKHAVRNGLIPIITLIGASLPVILGGSIVVEYIFEIDGMGKLAFNAVLQRDYSVILGLNILTAFLTMVGIFLADLAYAVVDPRISYR